MRDTVNLIKTQEQYESLKTLCANELGMNTDNVDIGLIADIGDGKYKVKVMCKHSHLYAMIYDGKRITEYARLIR
ncbi:MAG: hypothetical protein K2O08_03350 [Clostridia bacterium]|nr:hypothetical protein [Clostridia bacterium]